MASLARSATNRVVSVLGRAGRPVFTMTMPGSSVERGMIPTPMPPSYCSEHAGAALADKDNPIGFVGLLKGKTGRVSVEEIEAILVTA